MNLSTLCSFNTVDIIYSFIYKMRKNIFFVLVCPREGCLLSAMSSPDDIALKINGFFSLVSDVHKIIPNIFP